MIVTVLINGGAAATLLKTLKLRCADESDQVDAPADAAEAAAPSTAHLMAGETATAKPASVTLPLTPLAASAPEGKGADTGACNGMGPPDGSCSVAVAPEAKEGGQPHGGQPHGLRRRFPGARAVQKIREFNR